MLHVRSRSSLPRCGVVVALFMFGGAAMRRVTCFFLFGTAAAFGGRAPFVCQRHAGRRVSLGRRPSRPALGLCALVVALGIAPVVGVSGSAFAGASLPLRARAAAASCPSVIFIGARGSGEKKERSSRDMGAAVNMMASAMEAALKAHHLTLRTDADLYPADSVADLIPSKDDAIALAAGFDLLAVVSWNKGVDKYFRSIGTGISDAVTAIRREVGACPGSSLVLAGYSQGAMVMHQAELQLAAAHQANLLHHIAGTLLLGDGDRVPNTDATEFGTSKRSGEGVRTYLHGIARHDVESSTNTANICDEEDIVCDFDPRKLLRDHNPLAIIAAFKHAAHVHTTYATSQGNLLKDAADWLAAKLISAQTPVSLPPPPGLFPPPPPPPSATEGVTFPGGPLTVSVGPLGQCQSSYGENGDNYFPPDSNIGDCGFFLAFPASGAGQPVALQDTTWGFDGAAGPSGISQYVPVSQSPVTGSGTATEPFTEVTTFKLVDPEGNEDARITETTTYVDGASQFTSSYSVRNTTAVPIYFRSIYAGDLYVGDDDYGTGVLESGPVRFIGGRNVESGAIGGFQEVAEPAPAWSSFAEGCWNDVVEESEGRCSGASASDYGIWHDIETTAEETETFNESIEPTDVDNAVGVEWDQLRSTGLAAGDEQAFTIANVYRP